ncbi:UvrD-helicase domain-containing protein [Massilibacteroides sp.]|uniref:ATP-dependent helicase n=1 Tax=Massilibacteroides sp. TaxID=2034766 RepID=UPI00260796A6|nr:UvrD-helicase domain-containing protein [Massilibacteroides sp.]MDD4516396.1 3'-5' exonuclease [Massilibacteroides sp.]
MKAFLEQLNTSQREAVEYINGASLVIAGAGSGKTRVLTYKIAYLLRQGVPPQSILALTFTNKAAREMKERIGKLAEPEAARRLWMGTFHSIFARILRYEATALNYPSDFTIYDAADSKSLIKSIIKEMKLDDKVYRPGMIQARISNAKNALITYKAYEQSRELIEGDMRSNVPLIRDIYKRYQTRCFQAGAMDFDDLLLQTNILFRDHPEVLNKYRSFFQFVLVDEYQDTNFAQHLIVLRLSEQHGRICVVGDDAQSIYSFRGANIDNILQFKNHFPGCRIFKLERNYRSTKNIVEAANSLIHKNENQIEKNVYSEKEAGSKLSLISLYSDYEEAYTITAKIAELRTANRLHKYSDFAILYRTNAQSRIIEEALRKHNMPYRIYGGLSFYQRKEIKDIISYFRLVVNLHDEEALKRVINYPARGIGNTTLSKLSDAANEYNVSLWTVLCTPLSYSLPVNSGTAAKLQSFKEMILSFQEDNQTKSLDELTDRIMRETGIMSALAQDSSVEGQSKFENAQELIKGILEYCEMKREEGVEHVLLSDFLSEVALLTDQDNVKDQNTDKITLMTVHAAKGLEFKNVFVVGLEEDLFPSMMSKDSQRALEEERRLFYVAITRAEENCIITYAKSRFRNGKSMICIPSRFLKDIDHKYIEIPGESEAESKPDDFSFERQRFSSEGTSFISSRREPVSVQTPTSNHQKLTKLNTETAATAVSDSGDYKVGTRVSHDRFGEGEITALEGEGSNAKATVSFKNSGVKHLLLKYAKLTIL